MLPKWPIWPNALGSRIRYMRKMRNSSETDMERMMFSRSPTWEPHTERATVISQAATRTRTSMSKIPAMTPMVWAAKMA